MRVTLWQGWLLGTITMVTLVILLLVSWFYSTADIRRVQAYAKAAGISTTWEEAAFPAPTAAEQTASRDFARLAGEQKSLRSIDFAAAPRQIDPANAAMRDHFAAIPVRFWQELDVAIDALPSTPGCLYERISLFSKFEFIQWQRELVRLQAESLQCCPVAELPQHLARAVRLCHPMRNQSLLQQMVDLSCTAMLSSAVTSRRSEMIDPALRLAVAEQLRHLQQTMWDARRDGSRGETASMFVLYADPSKIFRLTSPFSASNTWEGIRNSLRYPLRRLVFRLNRERDLRHLVDVQIASATATDGADLIRRLHAILKPVASTEWLEELADYEQFYNFNDASPMCGQGLVKQQLVLLVLIADLTNAALPTDAFSATGAALQPVERQGAVIGWYSVGPNGTDDGGKPATDFGIPLRASFGKPLFADEPVLVPVPVDGPSGPSHMPPAPAPKP